jgi:drug/metabolite transporter (DMT)-like permease
MGIFMVGSSTLSLLSVNFTTATNASLVNAEQPLTTAIIAWVIYKDQLTLIQALGTMVGAIGIVTMVSPANFMVLQFRRFNNVNSRNWIWVLC